MFGIIRFILAITVALSHLGVTVAGYNPGVFAVVTFYLLAGMVSDKLLTQVYLHQPLHYYKDRAKRIFPLYFLVLIFAFFIYLLGANSYFLSATPSIKEYLSNLTIFPLSYYMYTQIDTFTLIPPAWSLAVELQFYLLAPFILFYKKITTFLLFSSLLVYIFASIGYINTDHYGYRLLPGVLFIFLLGALLHRVQNKQKKSLHLLITIYAIVLIVALYIFTIEYHAPYNYETITSLIVSIPILYLISAIKITKLKSFDRYLGRLSYSLFLIHFPILWLIKLFELPTTQLENTLLVLFSTTMISIVFISLESKIQQLWKSSYKYTYF